MLSALGDALHATLWQLALVLGPASVCAFVLHQIERVTSHALTRTFGWRASLLTGWIGTPVHELSHVFACVVFMHEIEEVKLFAPDAETGTLGLVRHRAPRGNPWAAVGRLFIGVAPLLGGTFVLWMLARTLWPEAELHALASLAPATDAAAAMRGAARHAWEGALGVLSPAHLLEPRFWLFLVLATCVGTHLSPSRDDLRGAAWGAVALVFTLWLVNLGAALFGGVDALSIDRVAGFTAPLIGLLVLAILLSLPVLAAVLLLTELVERTRGGGGVSALARDHGLRLALAAVGVAVFAWGAGWIDAGAR